MARLGHDAAVSAAGFTGDGARVVTAGYDGSSRFWDPLTGRELGRFAHPDWVQAFAVDPAGRVLVTAGYDGAARVWPMGSGP